jgi:hypothetical protein
MNSPGILRLLGSFGFSRSHFELAEKLDASRAWPEGKEPGSRGRRERWRRLVAAAWSVILQDSCGSWVRLAFERRAPSWGWNPSAMRGLASIR